jgi:hypothetical protein
VEPRINPDTNEIEIDEKGDPVKIGVVTNFKEDDAGGLVEDQLQSKRFVIHGAFDVKVNTGSGLPFKKSELEQRLLQLFDRQIIDDEEVLERMEYPNFEAVVERNREKQAQLAEQQQAQGAG